MQLALPTHGTPAEVHPGQPPHQGRHGVREAERLPRERPVQPIAVPPHSRISQVCGDMQMR